jgi:hypothetical protein
MAISENLCFDYHGFRHHPLYGKPAGIDLRTNPLDYYTAASIRARL